MKTKIFIGAKVMLTKGDATDMVKSIISYAQKFRRISDKQAWALACYCKENKITLKF